MTTPDYRAALALYDDVTAERWDAMAHRAAIKRTQTALAAPEAVDGICTGCDTPRHKAIAAVAKGGVACCPDCSTLTVADRNAIREAVAQRAAPEAVGVTDEPTMQEEALVALERIRSGDVSNGDDDFLLVEQGLRERSRTAHPAPVPVGERLPGVADEELLGLDELQALWNAQADRFNEWTELGIDEIIAFAQQQAVARYGTAHSAPVPVSPPSGHAYRYPDYRGGTTIRFNNGCEVNGSKPIEAVPYWFAPHPPAPVPVGERLPGAQP
jgi:hypothetical protein